MLCLWQIMQESVSVDIVNPELSKENGWSFSRVDSNGTEYPVCGRERSGLQAQHLWQLYQRANPDFTGTISVPILWVGTAHLLKLNEKLLVASVMDPW